MIEQTNLSTPCAAGACGWNFSATKDSVGCSSGDGSCADASFVMAKESGFFSKELADATDKINGILAKLPALPGLQLSILSTPFGALLAYVEPNVMPEPGSVNCKSTDDEIKNALGVSTKKDKGYRDAKPKKKDDRDLTGDETQDAAAQMGR